MSAFDDYLQLLNNNPKMDATKQFGGRAINNINSAVEGYSQWQRLQDQNFKPNQSVIASAFMHPQKGLSKLADWFTNNVNTAAGLPDPNQQDEASMYAYGPNIEQQAESGLNLAGLLQTGAFASGAAPKSAGGTVGSIRKPIDSVVTDNDFGLWNSAPDSFDKKWIKYFKTKWATDDDPLVKYVDEGGNIGPSLNTYEAVPNTHMGNSSELSLHNIHNSPHYMDTIVRNLSGGKINKSKFIYDPFDPNADIGALLANDHDGDITIGAIVNRLQSNTSPTSELKHVDQAQKLADYFREIAGTNQIAKTQAGKYFENANDIKAAYSNREGDIPEKIFDYTSNHPEQNIFYPEIPYTDAGIGGETSLLNKLPANINNMSLQEMVRQATQYDDNAIANISKARPKLLNSEGAKDITKMHQFDDGTSWNFLNSRKAMDAEAEMQGNCLKTQNQTPTQDFYSLRNANNEPILTMEYNPVSKSMSEIQPRFNGQNGFQNNIDKYGTHTKTLLDLLGNK